jgi:tetratricopeptide (TPR) repeat protein
VWGAETQRVVTSGLCYALTRDVLGLKRSLEDLTRLCRQGFKLDFMRELTRGEYHRERGQLAESKEALGRALELCPEGLRPGTLAALAETELAAGDAQRAIALAQEAQALEARSELPRALSAFRTGWVLLLAQAASGDLPGARARLSALEALPGVTASPVFAGMLHEGRARLALIERDAASFQRACAELERCYAPTRNPALLARLQRLMDAGAVRSGAPPASEVASEAVTIVRRPEVSMGQLLADCRGGAERAARALELLTWEAGGSTGYLYLMRGSHLVLAAPTQGEEPPDAVTRGLKGLVEAWCGDGQVTLPPLLPATPGEARWHPVLLVAPHGDGEAVVGAAALAEGALEYREVAPALLEDLARVLWQAGDATTRTRSA